MTDHEHEVLRTSLGAYLLGGLPPAETTAVEEHLAGCTACRAEVEALRPTAASLATAREPGGVRRDDSPPADLGTRVYAAVTAERAADRRRSWAARGALAAVAGAAAAAVLVVGLAVTAPDDAPLPQAVPLEAVTVSVAQPGLVADADLVNHTWGVEVKLSGSGFDSGERYRVSLLDLAGRRYPAGEFVGVGADDMLCNLNSSLLREQAASFEVRDRSGEVVATSTFA